MSAHQILVAEDEPLLRLVAVEMLEDTGFQVFEAEDGVAALALLQQNPGIALLITDIKMPRMDGYALVQAGLQLNPDLKILLMTGYAQAAPDILPAGITTLNKPFIIDRLSQLANEMLK